MTIEPLRESFNSLTPDAVLDAAEAAGFSVSGRFMQLNSLENRVFSIDTEDGRRIALKFYRPGRWDESQILEEHRFLAELKEAGLSVCAPRVFESGSTLSSAQGILFAAWDWSSGRIPEEFSDEMLYEAGRLLAGIHEIGAKSGFAKRPRIGSDTLIRAPLQSLVSRGELPSSVKERYSNCALAVAKVLDQGLVGMPTHRIHGDFHWGNLLWDGKRLSVLDFDDTAEGPAVQDIWLIAPAVDSVGKEQRATLLKGYRSLRPFDEAWLKAASALRAGRYVDYAAWISERKDSSAFKNAFPEFGTAEYWERETADLESLVLGEFERAEVPEALVKEYEEASKLTNKDYFFDID